MNTNIQKNKWITGLKREYWEYQGSMIWLPATLMALFLLLMFMACIGIAVSGQDLKIEYSSNSQSQEQFNGFVISTDDNLSFQQENTTTKISDSDVDIEIGVNGVRIKDRSSSHSQGSSDVDIEIGPQGISIQERAGDDNPNKANIDIGPNDIDITDNQHQTSSEPEVHIDFSEGELDSVKDNGAQTVSASKSKETIIGGLAIIHIIFIALAWIVAMYYLLNCLFSDRRDGSILFWKSMPVSETQNVLTKLGVALLVYPLVATIAAWITQAAYLVAALFIVGKFNAEPWSIIGPHINIFTMMLDGIVIVINSALLISPVFAWLLLASALAKRSPLMLATLPLIAIILLENWLWNSSVFFDWMARHTPSANEASFDRLQDVMMSQSIFLPNTSSFDLVSGILVAGVLTVAAVWCRNNRFEI